MTEQIVQSLAAVTLLVLLSSASLAQSPQSVTETEARQHLLRHTDPVYPAIARAAQVQGSVAIKITIDQAGKITAEKVLSGPPMLLQAASDAVKAWTFKPFVINGSAAEVTSTLTIPFELHPNGGGPTKDQERAAQAWFPVSDKCRNALKSHDAERSLEVCKQAVDLSLEAGDLTSSDQLAMMDSYQAYGHALLLAGQPENALEAENKAVVIAQAHLHDTDQEYAMPFFWRAIIEARLGDSDHALADFTTAEDTHRKAIEHLPSMRKIYSGYLATILNTHAQLLDAMGRTQQADKLRAEATALQRSDAASQ